MSLSREQLEQQYEERLQFYESLCKEIVTQLNELIRGAGIKTAMPLEYRIKPLDSLLEKCERKQIALKNIGEIADIAGIRIVVLFKRELDMVCQIILNNFEVLDAENAIERLSEDQFGYGAFHFTIKLKESWLTTPTSQKLRGLVAEIQLRTASQNIWALASHTLQYKRESHVPKQVRKAINRVAAILEAVDVEFEQVLQERENYITEINNLQGDESLNTDTLRNLLSKVLPAGNRSPEESYAELLDELSWLNIKTTGELSKIVTKHLESVFIQEKAELKRCKSEFEKWGKALGTTEERQKKGVFFTHGGLVRMALKQEFGKKFEDYLMTKLQQKAH